MSDRAVRAVLDATAIAAYATGAVSVGEIIAEITTSQRTPDAGLAIFGAWKLRMGLSARRPDQIPVTTAVITGKSAAG